MRLWNKGYTLIELCVVISILSILLVVINVQNKTINMDYFEFISSFHFKQSEALANAERVISEEYNYEFNKQGNINHAQTFHFDNGKSIVVELGGGSIVVKE